MPARATVMAMRKKAITMIMATIMDMSSTRMIITHMITATITMMTAITTTTTTSIITAIPMLMTTNERDVHAGMTEAETAALYRLMTWLSPSFPIGSFSYSSGIEWAVE